MIDVKLFKNGKQVVDLKIDSISRPLILSLNFHFTSRSMLVNSNYLFLTSFNKRTGDYKMLFRTRTEGNVDKDGEKVMKLNISPDKSPYKTGLSMPYTKHNLPLHGRGEYTMSIEQTANPYPQT